MILLFLFSFLTQEVRLEKKIEWARKHLLERQHLQIQLQDLFTSLDGSSDLPPLYTSLFPEEKKKSLVAVFDHGIDPDPLFSGTLIGRLYLDEKKNLSLAIWPLQKEGSPPWRKEALLQEVHDFSFQFLGEKKEADPKIKSVTSQWGWHTEWPQKRGDLPSFVRLHIEQSEGDLDFTFRIPGPMPIVTYWEGGFKP